MKKNVVTDTIMDTHKRAKKFLSAKNIMVSIVSFVIATLIIVIHHTELITYIEDINHYLVIAIDTIACICGGIVVGFIADFILAITLRGSKRAITIEKLFHSCIKYVVAIVVVVALLIIWFGKEYVSEVLGGLGILALIIGLGAQKLISDIIAGLFMVFEGRVEVGDIITVGSFRGTVEEIGLRTTVIVNSDGNIKVINNSNISEYVNMSKLPSYPSCSCIIDFSNDIQHVEEVITNALPSFKEKIPTLLTVPAFKGIDAIDTKGYVILIIAECNECDKSQSQRNMNRELLLLCEKEGIKLALPQVEIKK